MGKCEDSDSSVNGEELDEMSKVRVSESDGDFLTWELPHVCAGSRRLASSQMHILFFF